MKDKRMKIPNLRYNFLLITIAFICTVFCVSTGKNVNDGYTNIVVNGVSPARFKAPKTTENTLATERLRQQAADSVKEVYKINEDANGQIENQLSGFFDQVHQLRQDALTLQNSIEEKMTETTDGETAEPLEEEPAVTEATPEPAPKPNLSAYLTDNQLNLLLTMDTQTYNEFSAIVYQALQIVMEQGILEDSEEKSLVQLRDELEALGLTQDMRNLGYAIGSSFIKPNLEVDQAATEKAREERMAEVEPVVFYKGQNIVDEGDIISEEIFVVLESLGYVSASYEENIFSIIGGVFVILIMFVLFVLFVSLYNQHILLRKKEALLLFTLFMFILIFCRLFTSLPYVFIPILFITMLISMLLDIRLAIFMNILISITCMFIIKGDLTAFLYFTLSGTAAAILGRNVTERSNVITVGCILSVFSIVVILGLSMFFEQRYAVDMLYLAIYAMITGLLTVVLCMGSLPFWEAVFGIVTVIKLLDLTNPNNALLRRLTIEAPGTYHHSLIVGNLAETAAFDIDANPILARVGGYYHDIGKLKYPQYFAENQAGENPHDYMDPYSSIKVITSHVSYGLELAASHRLPRVVRDIIAQHHGNTLVKFFYYNAKKDNPDQEIDETDFRYQFHRPQSKEAAIVMLADTVEAAVRSILPMKKSFEEVEDFVKGLIKDKLDDNQLLDSGFTIKDLDTVTTSFMRVFKGMYHERITYPKSPEEEAEAHREDTPETDVLPGQVVLETEE